MQETAMLFERQINSLASELGYPLTLVEIQLYVTKLQQYGLKKFATACLEFRQLGYKYGSFPSIEEFESLMLKGVA